MSPRGGARRRVIMRRTLAGGQVLLAGGLVAGVVWAAGQPAVAERLDSVDLARAVADEGVRASTTVPLERAVLSCPGPELVGLAGAREVPLTTTATLVAAPLDALDGVPEPVGPGALLLEPAPAAAPDEGAEAGQSLAATLDGATSYLAVGSGVAAPGLVATQETRADTEEVVGLASVACQRPTSEAWVIGGGGGPGRAERIVLTNPGANSVVVDVTTYGADGVIASPGGQGLVVPALGRLVLLGDALAPDEASPAFSVSATGGDVTVSLVEAAIEGTRPVGFDVGAATVAPAEQQVIPGVLVPAEGSGTVTARLVNPGPDEAIATISVLSSAGEVPLPEAVVRVPAESSTDVAVPGLTVGSTSLLVRADAPVVAGVRTVVDAGGGGIDAVWALAQPAVTELAGAGLPQRDGLTRSLVLAAAGGPATVQVVSVAGGEASTTELLVPTDSTVVHPVTGDGVWIRQASGAGVLHGSVLTTHAEGEAVALSSVPLTLPPTSARRSEVVPLP